MQADEFMKHVSVRGEIHSREETENAIKAVFQTLKDRIVHDTGDNVKAQLPHEMQMIWESGFVEHVSHKVGGPTRMDLSGFIGRVGDRLGTDDHARAERVVRAVITTLRQSITPGAQESIEKELPEDIRGFWRSCQPPDMPKEVSEAHAQQARAQEGPPYEMEAPVVPTGEEQAGTGPWVGAGACEVCGMSATDQDMEMAQSGQPHEHEMRTEEGWHHREVGAGGQPFETEREEVMRGQAEHEVRPPSEDRLEIIPPPGEEAAASAGSVTHYRSDPQLEQEIRQMLEESEELEAEKIDVFVQAGNVTLRGHVKGEDEREHAGRIAAKALGVGDILNELTVEEMRPREGI